MSDNINQAHRLTIGASQVSKIMSYLQHDNLPKGAVSLISTMCRGTDEDLENAYELNTPAVLWGRDHEVEAVDLTAITFQAEMQFFGDAQKRFYAGAEYADFISALPDAIMQFNDGSIITVEVKCLDTHNHDYIIAAVGDSAEALKREDWAKYCQVHTQNICAESYYKKPVSSIIVFYDPRSTAIKLHYVIVIDADDPATIDHEFREKLQQRAKLARNLYDSIKAEPDRAALIYDGVMPETKLVQASTEIVTAELLELGLDAVVSTVAESFGIKVVNGALVGGEVFDCQTLEGRDLAKAFKNKVTKIRTSAEKLVDPFYRERYEKYQSAMKIKQGITKGINAIRDHGLQTFNEWEAEQKRIQDEILAAEAEKKRLADEKAEQVRQAILAKIETFTVSPQDVSSLELIAAKRLQVESVVIDVMFGEFEQQASYDKESALASLEAAEAGLKQAIAEAEKQARSDAFNVFKAKCAALSDPTHSFEYLQSQLAKLTVATLPDDEYLVAASDLRIDVIAMLNGSLIPAAKQRAIDLAEKLKAEAAELAAKEVKDSAVLVVNDSPVFIDASVNLTPEKIEEVKVFLASCDDETPLVPAINLPDAPEIIERIERENSIEHDIIAMYAALNPVLHAKVVEAAGKVMEFQNTPQNSRSSFLHNLFDADKQGKALRAAFCLIIK